MAAGGEGKIEVKKKKMTSEICCQGKAISARHHKPLWRLRNQVEAGRNGETGLQGVGMD
jgi:hypothetical protein